LKKYSFVQKFTLLSPVVTNYHHWKERQL